MDYFLISRHSQNVNKLKAYCVIDDPINLSDHLSIKICLDIQNEWSANTKKNDKNLHVESAVPYFDWKGGEKSKYYEFTRVLVEPIHPIHHRLDELKTEVMYLNEYENQRFKKFALQTSFNNAFSMPDRTFGKV